MNPTLDLSVRSPLEAAYLERLHAARIESELATLHQAVADARLALAELGEAEATGPHNLPAAAPWAVPVGAGVATAGVHALLLWPNGLAPALLVGAVTAAWVWLVDTAMQRRNQSFRLAQVGDRPPAVWPVVGASLALLAACAVGMWLWLGAMAALLSSLALLASCGVVLGLQQQALAQMVAHQRAALQRRQAGEALRAHEANLHEYRDSLLPERLAFAILHEGAVRRADVGNWPRTRPAQPADLSDDEELVN